MPFGGRFPEPMEILARAAVFIIAITIHEFMHAWSANKLGDPTARDQGRITLNPAAHFDPIGFLFGLLLIFGLAPIAWGKPVPVNPYRLRGGRRGMAVVAAAGPLSNLALAVVVPLLLLVVARLLLPALAESDPVSNRQVGSFFDTLLSTVIAWNVALFAFNLIPIPPLDGFNILMGIVPDYWVPKLQPLYQYGFMILIFAMFLPAPDGGRLLDLILSPVFQGALALILPLLRGASQLLGPG